MDIAKALTVILLVIIAGCMGFMAYKVYQNQLYQPAVTGANVYNTYHTDSETTQTAVSAPAAASVPSVYAGTVYGSTSQIRSMDLSADAVDWDGVVGNDGLIIHYQFYDEYGRQILFDNENVELIITLYGTDADIYGKKISPRNVIYKGYATLTSSDQGCGGALSGIRIPFNEIKTISTEKGIGQIKIDASFPTGGKITGYETFIYARNSV